MKIFVTIEENLSIVFGFLDKKVFNSRFGGMRVDLVDVFLEDGSEEPIFHKNNRIKITLEWLN